MEIDADEDVPSSISEVLSSSKDALLEAAETITALRLENEAITLRYAGALVDFRRSNTDLTNLKSSISPSTSPSRTPVTSQKQDVESAREILELKHSVEKQQRLCAASEEGLARAKRKAVEDGDLITKLQSEISELMELRVGTQKRLDMQVASNVNLVRDAELRNSESIISSSREEFLEAERRRLSAEILELSSKLQVVHSERVRETELSRNNAEKLRAEVIAQKKENSGVNERCKLLQEEICSIQKHRQKERDDAAAENKHLMELISMHKEELKDVETETNRYKKLLDTLALDKLGHNTAHVANGSNRALDSHAEALLKDLQKTLDQKLSQLNRQKVEMEEREGAERRLQIAFENEAREAEIAKRYARQMEDEKRVGDEENRNLRKKIRGLEEKILLAGNIYVTSPRNNNNDMAAATPSPRDGGRRSKRHSLTR